MARPQLLEQPHEQPPLWQQVLLYTTCYLAWLLFVAVGFWLLLSLRTNLFDLSTWLGLDPWQLRGIDRFAIFGLGLVWFVSIFVIENYLRVGVGRQVFWQRVQLVGLILGSGMLLSWVLQRYAIFA